MTISLILMFGFILIFHEIIYILYTNFDVIYLEKFK